MMMMMMMMMMSTMRRAMLRQFSSIATSKAPTSVTVSNVISKYIRDLSKKHGHVLKLRQIIQNCRMDVLDMMQHEVLQSGSRVEHQLGLLQKLAKLITTTRSHFPLSVIYKYLDDLHQQLDATSQVEESISIGAHIDMEGQELLNSKSVVVYQINVLRQVLHDIAWERELALDDDDQLQNPVRLPENITTNLSSESPFVQPCMKIDEKVESERLHKRRYLLISNGCQIHCLDLKRRYPPLSISSDALHLPIVATLNLLKENLPTIVGLFKWRSNAYMIGGQELPTKEEEPSNIWWSFKPTSSCIYGLSLNDSFISHTESISMGNLLRKPKIWPIVEEINGQMHVIDCVPGDLCNHRSRGWTGSHEVLDSDSFRWIREVPMPEVEENIVIRCYLAVGNKIYAKSAEGSSLVFDSVKKEWDIYAKSDERSFPVFDSEKKEWDMAWNPLKSWPVQDVWDILDNNSRFDGARCVGGFPYGDPRDPLYVVIAPKTVFFLQDKYGAYIVAFLVNSSGKILCSQHLTNFFSRPGSLRYVKCEGSAIIEVEEGEEEDNLGEKKKTMCSIMIGSPWDNICSYMYVLINIFSVEELPEAADKVRKLVKESDGQAQQPPVELEFARIHVMERHVFKTGTGRVGSRGIDIKMQACFL